MKNYTKLFVAAFGLFLTFNVSAQSTSKPVVVKKIEVQPAPSQRKHKAENKSQAPQAVQSSPSRNRKQLPQRVLAPAKVEK